MTPSDRLEAYRWAKENLHNEPFMCWGLHDWCESKGIDFGGRKGAFDGTIMNMFPEFSKQKPKKPFSRNVWFERNDIQSRHLVLSRCIAECEKLIKKETI